MTNIGKQIQDYREEQYKALKKQALGSSQAKDQWVPWIHGKPGDKDVEISCVHTYNPHGLLSWGWDGQYKIIIHSEDISTLKKDMRKRIHEGLIEVSKGFCDVLNKQFPNGIR